jgi:hypothetical protein
LSGYTNVLKIDLECPENVLLNGTIKGDDPSWVEYIDAYNVIVTRESRPIDTAFTVSIIILVCIANIAMGCKTDIGVVKATLKKPIAPLTGLASQFLLMPLVNIGHETWKCADPELEKQIRRFPYVLRSDVQRLQQIHIRR